MTANHSVTSVIQGPGRRLRPGRLEILALVAIVLLALALRAYHLGTKSLWLDELNLLRSADGHGFLFRRFGQSILDHPPAYLFLLRVVMLTLGREEWIVRLPALIASVASIPALWMLGRTLFGPMVALMAALLLTLAPMHVAYGQEAHSYGLYCLLSILLLWALVRAAQAEVDSATQMVDSAGADRRRARWLRAWGLFIVLATLSLYVHYYAFYLVALSVLVFPLFVLDVDGGGLMSLWREPARCRMLVRLVAALAIVAVLYLPQIIFGIGNSVTYAGNLSSALPNKSPAEAVGWAIRRATDTATSGPLTTLATMVVAFTGMAWLLWKRRFLAGAFLLIVILPLPPSLWMAYQTGVEFNARRIIFILPVLVLVAAVGLLALVQLAGWLGRQAPANEPDTIRTAAQSRRVIAIAAVALIAALGVFSARSLNTYYRTPKQDWKGAGRVLAAHSQPADAVVAPPRTARNLTWYYPQVKPIEGNLPDELQALCRVAPRVYFAVMPNDALPRESAQWISQNFVEVPLKNLSLYYRNCTMNTADWYGAGAGELFKLAYDPGLPYQATQRAGAQYQEMATQDGQGIVSETVAAMPEEPTPAMPATESAAPAASPEPDEPAEPGQSPAVSSDSPRAKAEALLQAGQAGKALDIFSAIVEDNPDDRGGRMGLAAALAATNRTDEALDEYKRIERDWPGFPWSFIRRGELLEALGQERAALNEYRATTRSDHRDPDAYFVLGFAFMRLDKQDEAIAQFQAGLALDPNREGPRKALEQLLQKS